MRITLDCIPCLFNQGLFAARKAGCPFDRQQELMNAIAREIPNISFEATPPEISVDLYRIIREFTGLEDPFADVKRESNDAALSIYEILCRRVADSRDPLLTAVEVAVAGNIIDYGANVEIDLEEEIRKILDEETLAIGRGMSAFFDPDSFKEALSKARNLVYLGDNAGEIVFDRVLIETIKDLYPSLTIRFAVRTCPIINDVTMEDALQVGMDRICEVIDSGSPAPGAVLGLCSPEFRETLSAADLIISKGQGNYESLSGRGMAVFYLLKVKCRVIAEDIGTSRGDVCLFQQ